MQMRTQWILMSGLCLAIAGPASAISTTFDFEDGNVQRGSTELSGLGAYMTREYGSAVDSGDARWFGSSNTYRGSDAIVTNGRRSTLNFDPLADDVSSLSILSVSFDYAVLNLTGSTDFGLDVYDDARGRWINDVFAVDTSPNTGVFSSGLIDLAGMNSRWEITRLRFHDSGTFDVGMDNLTVTDNRRRGSPPMPEPSAVGLFGLGALIISRVARKGARV